MYSWFEENKITWVSILASMAALEVLCIGISVYILTRVKKLQKLRFEAFFLQIAKAGAEGPNPG